MRDMSSGHVVSVSVVIRYVRVVIVHVVVKMIYVVIIVCIVSSMMKHPSIWHHVRDMRCGHVVEPTLMYQLLMRYAN